jgi:hypothetical protein
MAKKCAGRRPPLGFKIFLGKAGQFFIMAGP